MERAALAQALVCTKLPSVKQELAWIPTSLKVPKFLGNRRLKVQKKT